ncbi:hypothetical protein C8P64_3158 [Christiangramia gaetbulicola]|uniref:DUF3149 domain-containing protein n=1 Tax=Christiangramia gaetbulicola TaxID=703340 RepID=A0A2T6ACX5_9FLAO|nr:hypothetical protein [Christiangramia gaetbulicola]PTX41659.1 hypothetical protein C8P64_3158 [Christiangramia gaetbulicola]
MLSQLFIPLVNWTLGTIIIIVFGVVCLALMLIVNKMVNSDRKKDN